MRNLILVSASISLVLILSGCLMFSLNPLSRENECLPDGLPGTWADNDTEYAITLSADKKTYDVVELDLRSKDSQPMRRTLIVSKIEGSIYGSAFLGKGVNLPHDLGGYAIPAYQIVRLKLEGDKLAFQLFNPKLFKEKDIPEPSYVEVPDFPNNDKSVHIYGANPKELREWLAKYGDKIFSDDLAIPLVRKNAEAKPTAAQASKE